jgi:hypothetical protein
MPSSLATVTDWAVWCPTVPAHGGTPSGRRSRGASRWYACLGTGLGLLAASARFGSIARSRFTRIAAIDDAPTVPPDEIAPRVAASLRG